ncbi:hypothetical protein C1H76_4217 [Elsinoe australis]|uniref:NmrA-like domain-containing protein n=1 Tax=Elsinoe australis TaxID=40998 RepID=A0A4U7B3K3_9PEZI|nr:hypothetical protein C1H76_4217 [Elsinoe australis]
MAQNTLSRIAIVGASGTAGKHVVAELLKTGKHEITAITRSDSTATFPSGVTVAKVDYSSTASLVAALKGKDCLIITMAVTAPPEQETKLIEAAAEAGVPWVLPNEWGYEYSDSAGQDVFFGPGKKKTRQHIESLGVTSWIGVACGFWYEFSLAGGVERYGFDLEKKEVTLFDEGKAAINTSTWAQVGRAVAALLTLPVKREGGASGSVVEDWKNKHAHFSSFTVSQRDMFESLQRVTGTKEGDWKVKNAPVEEVYKEGKEQMMKGDRRGFGKLLYSRMFFKDQAGRQDLLYGLDDEKLGLPKEDLDEATKRAVGLHEDGYFKQNY